MICLFRWGEVIPLLFINATRKVRVVIFSQPTRRYNETLKMTTELTNLGTCTLRGNHCGLVVPHTLFLKHIFSCCRRFNMQLKTYIVAQSLSLPSLSNSFKTCKLYVDFGKAFQRRFKVFRLFNIALSVLIKHF